MWHQAELLTEGLRERVLTDVLAYHTFFELFCILLLLAYQKDLLIKTLVSEGDILNL